jgi:hypothetical protein
MTVRNKQKLNEEFTSKYGGLKTNCFPRPGRGCRCTEKDASGNEVIRRYESDADCKVFEEYFFNFSIFLQISGLQELRKRKA